MQTMPAYICLNNMISSELITHKLPILLHSCEPTEENTVEEI